MLGEVVVPLKDYEGKTVVKGAGTTVPQTAWVRGTLDGVNPQLITIGEYCVVGQASALLTHCPIRGPGKVVLEDHVWIGYGAIVLPGVTVGRCSIVGAGAVVTNSVPPNSIVAGVPARVLRELTATERKELIYKLEAGEPIGKA